MSGAGRNPVWGPGAPFSGGLTRLPVPSVPAGLMRYAVGTARRKLIRMGGDRRTLDLGDVVENVLGVPHPRGQEHDQGGREKADQHPELPAHLVTTLNVCGTPA
jgi:hypothetical protein